MLALVALFVSAPLHVWHSYRAAEAEVLQAIAGDDVDLQAIPFDVLQTKLTQAFLAGDPPDAFLAPHGRVREWANHLREQAPLGDVPAALASLTINDKLVGIPYSLKALALVRNLALQPDPVQALEQLAIANNGFALGFDTKTFYFFSPFFMAGNESLLERFDAPVQTQSLEWLRKQSRGNFLARGMDHTQLLSLFEAGRITALVDGPWVLSELKDLSKVATQRLPDTTFGTPRPFLTIDAIFVPQTANAERATAWARRTADKTHCQARMERALQITPHADCQGNADTMRVLAPFFEAVSSAAPIPTDPRMEVTWTPLDALLSGVVGSDRPIATLQAQARREFQRLDVHDTPAPWWLNLILLVPVVLLFKRKREASEPRSLTGLAFLSPVLLFALPLLIAPMLLGAALSLFSHNDSVLAWVGVGNFVTLLSHPTFYFTLVVTVLWTIANLAAHVTLGVSIALLLDRNDIKLRGVYRALLVLPWALPNYLSALVFHHLFNFQLGAINQTLVKLGINRVDWFGEFLTSFTANLTANAWLGFPFIMVVTLGALQNIDNSLREAILLDGATAWQRFRHLTLPSIVPVLTPALILSAVWTFNMFNVIYLVSGGEPRGETEILITEAYRWAFERGGRYGYAAAYCVLIFVILWLFSQLMERKRA